ncbi:hypothetical protein [Stenotrophomonas maltophilia]|uniref:hypothetical protein n=1 Tax=Stenotrophomonas maltophilia TaxID=40324 RepID=UPI00301A1C43
MITEGGQRVLSAVETVHAARFKRIVSAHGWPTLARVGEDASDAAWLLAQHADKDLAFQRSVAEAMERFVTTGHVKASSFAYLWDRKRSAQAREGRRRKRCGRLANASPVKDERIANQKQRNPRKRRRIEFPFCLSIFE